MSEFRKVLTGTKPTVVMHSLIAEDPQRNNWELADDFMDFFESVDETARHVVWNWSRPGGRRGPPDSTIDELLLKLLREAGYLSPEPVPESEKKEH